MTVPYNIALAIHAVSLHGNDFPWNGNACMRQTHSVKLQLEKTLAHKVTRIFFSLEMTGQIAASGQDRVSELVQALQLADEWVADCDSRGRKIWLIECAAEKCPGGYYVVLSARGVWSSAKKQRRKYQIDKSAVHVQPPDLRFGQRQSRSCATRK